MTLSYCSLSCWSSASRVSDRCCRTEKVPRIPQATATVSEMARIRRAAIDRSLNMGTPNLRGRKIRKSPRKCLTTAADHRPVVLRFGEITAVRTGSSLCGVAQAGQEGIDALEQCIGVLAELAGRDHHVVGERARLTGGGGPRRG